MGGYTYIFWEHIMKISISGAANIRFTDSRYFPLRTMKNTGNNILANQRRRTKRGQRFILLTPGKPSYTSSESSRRPIGSKQPGKGLQSM